MTDYARCEYLTCWAPPLPPLPLLPCMKSGARGNGAACLPASASAGRPPAGLCAWALQKVESFPANRSLPPPSRQAMEQQSISISKAGIVTQLQVGAGSRSFPDSRESTGNQPGIGCRHVGQAGGRSEQAAHSWRGCAANSPRFPPAPPRGSRGIYLLL